MQYSKYLNLFMLIIGSFIFLSSCMKEHTCQCTKGSLTMKAVTKTEAKRGCEAGGGQDQNGNPYCTLP